jgi:hypothetical protein
LLRYFSESDLRPFDLTEDKTDRPTVNLLTAAELVDLQVFAAEFARHNEVNIGQPGVHWKPHLRTFVTFLQALGAVRIDDGPAGLRCRTTGKLAGHLPEILSIYLCDSLTVLDSWNRTHLIPEDSISALEILRQLELRRIELTRRAGRVPRPLAERPVAFAVFHALNRHGKDCYLFEINKDWRRLNFIGGKQEDVDRGDFQATVSREISEELGISQHRLSLTRLNSQPLVGFSLSGNTGSLTRYPCVLFGVRVEGQLWTRLQDRWLTEQQIISCKDLEDCPIMVNPVYLSYLLEGVPSRLARTPLSTATRVRSSDIRDIVPAAEEPLRRWVRILTENRDLLAAILTLLAAVIALALAR